MQINDQDWVAFQDPSGFTIRHPPGWSAFRHPCGAAMVVSPDGSAFVAVQDVPMAPGATLPDIVAKGLFPAAAILNKVQPGPAGMDGPNRAHCELRFQLPDGTPAAARVTAEPGLNGVVVSICAAREPQGLQRAGALLAWIAAQFRPPLTGPSIAPTLSAAPKLSFTRFTDPQAGTFHLDLPQGWQTRGGFHHAGLGDRRMFAEAHSPDGISLFFGDPNFPQVFYHNPMAWGEDFIPYPTGCVFLNLEASAKKLAHYYLKNAAPKRFGTLQATGERDRRDMVETATRRNPQMASFVVTAHEVGVRSGNRSGQLLAFAQGNKNAWMGDNWAGNVVVWLAPPGLEALANEAVDRMTGSFEVTPQLNPIVMRDEQIIAGNGQVANMNQQQWFQGQQAAHQAQVDAGNMMVDNYWQQQRVNDSIVQSWNQSQQSYDNVFQQGSDAMLGNQRLYDETLGREYNAPSGANYYWVDPSGNVFGTNTDTPPDYQTDYRQLKKR